MRLNLIGFPPPMPGESLSSFIERGANFYAISPLNLLRQLEDARLRGHRRPDFDFSPPPELLRRLEDYVPDWSWDSHEHKGFLQWYLKPIARSGYCVRCFEEDLAAGHSPYFRLDWAAAAVTSCWKHDVPLSHWHQVDSHGFRRLPRQWARHPSFSQTYAEGFTEAQRQVAVYEEQRTHSHSPGGVLWALQCLRALQLAIEKPSREPLLAATQRVTAVEKYRAFIYSVIRHTAIYWASLRVGSLRAVSVDASFDPWFEPPAVKPPRSPEGFADMAITTASNPAWRRAYFWYASVMLAGHGETARGSGSQSWLDAVDRAHHNIEQRAWRNVVGATDGWWRVENAAASAQAKAKANVSADRSGMVGYSAVR